MPKVTVVMSVYNKWPYIKETLQSVRKQTLEDIEILIVDNASTDKSSSYLQENAKKDNRISLYRLEKNLGPAGGFNYGMRRVRGDYFVFVDADDLIDERYAEALYCNAKKYNADISMCRNDIVYSPTHIEQLPYEGPREFVLHDDEIYDLIPQTIVYGKFGRGIHVPETGATWINLYRTDFVKSNNLYYNPKLWIFSDWEYNMRAFSKAKSFCFIDQTLYHFRQIETSVTHIKKFNPKSETYMVNAIDAVSDNYVQLNIKQQTDEMKEAVIKFTNTCLNSIYNNYYQHLGSDVSKEDLKEMIARVLANKNVKEFYKKNKLKNINGLRNKLNFYLFKNKCVNLIYLKKKIKELMRG